MAANVKRYALDNSCRGPSGSCCSTSMREDNQGQWIRYADVESVQKKCTCDENDEACLVHGRENWMLDRALKAESDLVAMRKERDEALGTHDGGERCQSCGWLYATVWKADDALWGKVTGRLDEGGLRCPLCFMREATDEDLYWSVGSGEFPDCVLDHAFLDAAHKMCRVECRHRCNKRVEYPDCPLYNWRPAFDSEKEYNDDRW